MELIANDPNRKSWISVSENSDFPIQNIPFGVFLTKEDLITIGSRIGDKAIDLGALHQLGYFSEIPLTDDIFLQDTLNDFIADGRTTWRKVRNRIAELFDLNNQELQSNEKHIKEVLFDIDRVEMLLPVDIGDYTDFYSSKEHATNVGTMFRDPDNALLPNWLHLPVAYHGRSSSVYVSNTPTVRPSGQVLPNGSDQPVFKKTALLDFELEMGFICSNANHMGEQVTVSEAKENIFGMVLLNDWSARDIQKWEYIPLGPFLAKNFSSIISPWVVTLDALEPYKTPAPVQEPKPLDYLDDSGDRTTFDIALEVDIQSPDGVQTTVCESNFKHLYWTIQQQLAHHTVNGCAVRAGDLMGSGTISGPDKKSFGSMLELTWKGTEPVVLNNGESRKFIQDGDRVIMKGYCKNGNTRIGFGTCESTLVDHIDH
ncbi:MAG: fumarylacetoacetase [Flavobacteriaceae bacterium]